MEEESAVIDQEEENRALVNFAVDNNNLIEIEDLDLAKVAIQEVLERHGPSKAVECLTTTLLGEELANHLEVLTRETRHRAEFVRALVNLFTLDQQELAANRLHIPIERKVLTNLIHSPDDLAIIFRDQKLKRDCLSNELLAFVLTYLNTDAYWEQRVQQLIERRDFRRAWDELYGALSGWPGKGRVLFCLNASLLTVGRLGDELYSAMQKAGAISQAGLKSWQRRASRKRTALINLRHEQDRRIAALFSDRSVEIEVATMANVSLEGLMLIHLANHFRNERNLRRAVKKARARGAASVPTIFH